VTGGYRPVDALVVKAWGVVVGAVVPHTGGYFAFQYEPGWARLGIELSPSLMPTRPIGQVHVFAALDRGTYHGLPPMLSDSIPDRFGNALINAHLGQRGVAPNQITALDRLAYVGSRGMGALTFEPRNEPHRPKATALELVELAEQARRAAAGELGDDGHIDDIAQLIEVGTSAGGARAKAVVAWNRGTGQLRAGNADAPNGFEHWLLKFDGSDPAAEGLARAIDSGRVEYAYSLMARDAGIDMAETHLLEAEGAGGEPRAHFMTRRFDRPGGKERIHMQTLCAIAGMDYGFHGVHDYSGYLLEVASLGLDLGQAFRRMVFNVLARNGDDHTKNFSFLMDRHGAWQLAPAYDLTFHPWLGRHQMSVAGRFGTISSDDVLAVADRFQVHDARRIVNEVLTAVTRWREHAAAAGIPADLAEQIEESLAKVRGD